MLYCPFTFLINFIKYWTLEVITMSPGNSEAYGGKAEKELRRRVESILTPKMREDESLFSRFLIARNYDLDAAETMLRNHINWRNINKVDTILSDYKFPQYGDAYLGQTRLGFDKEGSRVAYLDVGNMDFKGMLKTYKKRDLQRYVIYTTEDDVHQMRIQSAKTGIYQDKICYIYNIENLAVSNVSSKAVLDLFTSTAQMIEANYPERMKSSLIINASSAYTVLWSAIKPLLSSRTLEKLKIFGNDGWKEELLKRIDADVLPVFLGGNRTDPNGDPMCRTFVNHGLLIPEKYYVDPKASSISRNSNAQKLVISRKSKAEVKLEIIHPGSSIEWEFELKDYDIGFSLIHKESASKDSDVTELIPYQRIEADLLSESGVVRCENRGVYIIVFDNTYSWMHHKEIYYIVSVVGPNNPNKLP